MSQSTESKPWHRHFETVGSICAIVVGLAALYVSWDQGRVMRQDVAASVWPALQVDGFASQSANGFSIGLRVQNAGVGPAQVERINIEYKGEPVENLSGLIKHMPPQGDLSLQTIDGRVIAAGAIVEPFVLHYQEAIAESAVDVMAMLSEEWAVEVCYCSVLKQCWVSGQEQTAPQEVASCDGQATDLTPVPSKEAEPGGTEAS